MEIRFKGCIMIKFEPAWGEMKDVNILKTGSDGSGPAKNRECEIRVDNLIFSKKLLSFNIEKGRKSPAAKNVIVV